MRRVRFDEEISFGPLGTYSSLWLLAKRGTVTGVHATGMAAKSFFQVDPATAGSISGTIHFTGRRPAPVVIDVSSDPSCEAAHLSKVYDDSLILGKHGQVANAFLYIKSGLEGKTFSVPSMPVTIDQRGCWFRPRVLGLQVSVVDLATNSVTHRIKVGSGPWGIAVLDAPGDH